MSNVIPFDFHGHSVRVINIEDDPWFLARDVAEILEYKNPLKAIRDHCKGVNETVLPSAGGPQTVKIIPERDVYRLVMRSKLPSAEAFEEWVVGEVLPSIRKTGGYQVGNVVLPDFSNPAEAARAWADQHEKALKLEHERNEARKTKAWIGSKREATAMAKASAATRKANQLERRLGHEESWKQVKAIPWLAEEFAISRTMYQQVGKKLKAISDEMGLEVDKIPSAEYGEIKSYHIDAINELWRRLQEDSELLAKYRKGEAA
ncbi:MAG: prophage antirepressor [Marinobacter sp. T13-3]|nr:MAG: prophage antirepressor [Marinobacter sp. T13-3]